MNEIRNQKTRTVSGCDSKNRQVEFEPICAPTGELNSASEVAKSFFISKTKLPSMLVFVEKGSNFLASSERNFAPPSATL